MLYSMKCILSQRDSGVREYMFLMIVEGGAQLEIFVDDLKLFD